MEKSFIRRRGSGKKAVVPDGKEWKMMGQKKKTKAKVVCQTEIADGIFDMWMETELAQTARAGQFLCIYPQFPDCR